jgi:hypothetical protein
MPNQEPKSKPKDVEEPSSEGLQSTALFSVGDRFRFKDMKTMWEVLEVVERGWVVGQYLPGSPYHHGHKHLIEWSHRPNLISLNVNVEAPNA